MSSTSELLKNIMAKYNKVRSILRAIECLECFANNEKLKFNEIGKITKLSNGTVYRIIETLMSKNLIEKDKKSKEYMLGKGIFLLGNLALKNYSFPQLVHPYLEKLAEISKETVNASIFYDNSIIFIDSVKSSNNINISIQTGKRNHINTSASGKAVLAYFKEDKVDDILRNATMPKITEKTMGKTYTT